MSWARSTPGVRLIRDMLRLLAKAAAEHVEDHPADACPCRFCRDSEAAVARTSADVATVAGMARMSADVMNMAVVDDPDDRGPRDGIGAELRRLPDKSTVRLS